VETHRVLPALIEELSADPRVTVRRGGEPDAGGRCVVYWMQRAQRALDNPALEAAIGAANRLELPLTVFFCLLGTHPSANLRHYAFMIEGLADTEGRLARRGIGFVIRRARGSNPLHELTKFCSQARAAMVLTDENPMRASAKWRVAAARTLDIPLLSVDADVVVPSAVIGREQYAARTLRPRIHSQLDRFLRPVGNRALRVPWNNRPRLTSLKPSPALLSELAIDRSVPPVPGFHGGTTSALSALKRFVRGGLNDYGSRRNHPEADGTSRLSPYLHFGHLGPHTVALAALASDVSRHDREAFIEELIVRRELAINFVRFNSNYDRLMSCEPWALRTLEEHRGDPRSNRYTRTQLERAQTHDPLWNAEQRQMVESGWMHGYMRMYWAKKILEWSPSAALAYQTAVLLNDRYELDGRDPNGYAGIAWAIGGKHDRAWGPERNVYGKIRYMSYDSTSRKFDSRSYIRRWRGDNGGSGT
jgi:deoxyribodipyrimidine photo-lyase